MEDSEKSRTGKSPKNESIEDELESRIIKAFFPLESKNQKIKIIKDILSSIKSNDIKVRGIYFSCRFKKKSFINKND